MLRVAGPAVRSTAAITFYPVAIEHSVMNR